MELSVLFSFAFSISFLLNYLKASSDNHFAFLHFFFFGMVLITASCTMSQTSVQSSSSTLSDLIPWIYLSLPLYSCKGFDLGHTWVVSGFPYFLQFKSEFGNIYFHDLSHSQLPVLFLLSVHCFSIFGCKEYKQCDFSIDHLVMSMCRVFSCVAGRGRLLWPVHSLGRTVSLCLATFCTPRPILPVTPAISWLPTFAF